MTEYVTKEATLSAKQSKAIAALLGTPNVESAAERAGVTPRTIYRWLSGDQLFQEAYRRARQRAVDAAISSLQAVMSEAVETLRKNLKARNPSIQVRAAISLLELGFKATEVHELERRLGELERHAEGWASW